MKVLMTAIAAGTLLSATMAAQSGPVSASARTGIDAGNQAWIDGVKSGNVALIMATYAEDAVDCGSTGECVRGRVEIERHMKDQLSTLGRARSAEVHSWGSTEQGDFVYEWGKAEAEFPDGKRLAESYLTAWQKQSDGSWKIFRNMVIPDK